MREDLLGDLVELADVLQAKRLEAIDEVTLRLVAFTVTASADVDGKLAVDAVPVGRRDSCLRSTLLEDELVALLDSVLLACVSVKLPAVDIVGAHEGNVVRVPIG